MCPSHRVAQDRSPRREPWVIGVNEDQQLIQRRHSRMLRFMPANIIHGGCLCGAVRYAAAGEPFNVTHCHCADCRRSSGAAFVTWASFRRADFRFTQGEPRVLLWAERLRSFCAACGTPLTFMIAPGAAEVDVTVCTFDQPAAISPADHTWVEDRLPWILLADQLPCFERKRPNHGA